jgi:hypothetical protein
MVQNSQGAADSRPVVGGKHLFHTLFPMHVNYHAKPETKREGGYETRQKNVVWVAQINVRRGKPLM